MSTAVKGKKKNALPVAPSENSQPRGSVRYTQSQDAAYNTELEEMNKQESAVKKGSLQLAYYRGYRAHNIMANPEKYGRRTKEQIAADLGVKVLTLKRSMQFNERITTAELKELCDMKRPPAWRIMTRWVNIEDADKRAEMLKDILSGNVTSANFDGNYRKILEKGPSKPKCPADPTAMFRKIEAEAQTMTQQLGWIDDADKKLSSITDAVKRRKAREVFKVTLDRLKEVRGQLDNAISRGESLVAD